MAGHLPCYQKRIYVIYLYNKPKVDNSEYFYPLLLQQFDRMKGRFRDYMCFKADQCPINIKKYCFNHNLNSLPFKPQQR